MSTPSPSPTSAATFHARSAYGVGLLSVVLGAAAGAAVCAGLGWASGQALTTAATLACLVWAVASILSVQILVIGSGLQADRLGMAVLAASMARMLTALLIGVLAYLLVHPEGRTFWIAFLGAGLFALIGEAVWAIRTINAATAAQAGARPTPGAV